MPQVVHGEEQRGRDGEGEEANELPRHQHSDWRGVDRSARAPPCGGAVGESVRELIPALVGQRVTHQPFVSLVHCLSSAPSVCSSFCNARLRRLITVPSGTPRASATSRVDRSSSNRRTTTALCLASNDSTARTTSCFRSSCSSASVWSGASIGGSESVPPSLIQPWRFRRRSRASHAR